MIDENQTQFNDDQVLWQEQRVPVPVPVAVSAAEPSTPQPTEQTPEQKKKRVLMIGGGVVGGLFILTMLIAMAMGLGKNGLRLVPEPTPTPMVKREDDAFDKAYKLLQQDIVKADPTTGDLPFPPVNPVLYVAKEN